MNEAVFWGSAFKPHDICIVTQHAYYYTHSGILAQFPTYVANVQSNGCVYIDDPKDDMRHALTMAYAGTRFPPNPLQPRVQAPDQRRAAQWCGGQIGYRGVPECIADLVAINFLWTARE